MTHNISKLKRGSSLLQIQDQINETDKEQLKTLISFHKFFRNSFIEASPELELSAGHKLEDQQDFKEFVNSIVSHLTVKRFGRGEFIINMHDQGDEMYVINEGRLVVIRRSRSLRREKD